MNDFPERASPKHRTSSETLITGFEKRLAPLSYFCLASHLSTPCEIGTFGIVFLIWSLVCFYKTDFKFVVVYRECNFHVKFIVQLLYTRCCCLSSLSRRTALVFLPRILECRYPSFLLSSLLISCLSLFYLVSSSARLSWLLPPR